MKRKYQIVFSLLLLAVVLFAAVPKVYIHSLLGHTHEAIETINNGTSVSEDQNTKECNFEKFDTPVYYTVFKFILNFLPLKDVKQTSHVDTANPLQKRQYNSSPLRGPPVA